MAKSLLELAVDTGSWDSGLKKAQGSLNNFISDAGGLQKALAENSDKMTEFVKMMGNMDSTASTSKGQLRDYQNTLIELTQAYRSLSDADKNGEFGKALNASIQSITEKAGAVKDAMSDVQASIKNAASDTRAFDQIAGGMRLMSSGFQTLQGAAKLFGIENKDSVETIAKLQAAMAVTNGLMAIQNALQKQSALMQGVFAMRTALATAAQSAFAAATGSATAAQTAFNVVAKANPYGLLLTAIAAVVAAYKLFASGAHEAEVAQKSLQESIDDTSDALSRIETEADFDIAIAEACGASQEALRALKYEALNTALALADANLDRVMADPNHTAEQFKQAQDLSKRAWDNWVQYNRTQIVSDVKARHGGNKNGGHSRRTSSSKRNSSTSSKSDTTTKKDEINTRKLPDELFNTVNKYNGATAGEVVVRGSDYYESKRKSWIRGMRALTGYDTSTLRWMADVNGIKDMNGSIQNLNTGDMRLKFGNGSNLGYGPMAQIAGPLRDFVNSPGFKSMGDITSGVNQIVSGIEGLGIEIPQGFKKTINAFQSLLSIVTGISTVLSAIAIMKAFPLFHNGGIVHAAGGFVVPGLKNGGRDTVPAILSPGEIVMNAAQQRNLAGQLRGIGNRNTTVEHTIKGSELRLLINNDARAMGRATRI